MTTTLALAALHLLAPYLVEVAPHCQSMTVTGYSRYEHSSRTFDGTPILTPEPIAAASWWIPIDSVVEVEGVGSFRVADRGSGLGPAHIDVAVDSREAAYAITSVRQVCVYPPGEEP